MNIFGVLLYLIESSLPQNIYAKTYEIANSKFGRKILLTIPPVSLIICIPAVYFYWMIEILPGLLLDQKDFWWYLCYIGGTYLFHGICTHYYLMTYRESNVPEYLTVPFIIDNEDFDEIEVTDDELNVNENSSNEIEKIEEIKDDGNGSTIFSKLGLEISLPSKEWHPCFICKFFVCPGVYHCNSCNKCITRRDHHCVLTNRCIGEMNHVNFIGFILFLTVGSLSAFVTAFILDYQNYGLSCLANFLKPLSILLIPFSEGVILYGLIQIVLVGVFVAAGFFIFYFRMCLKGQTCFDRTCALRNTNTTTTPTSSYTKFENFLGPNAILKILFPFCFACPTGTHYDRNEFMSEFNKLKTLKTRIFLVYEK